MLLLLADEQLPIPCYHSLHLLFELLALGKLRSHFELLRVHFAGFVIHLLEAV